MKEDKKLKEEDIVMKCNTIATEKENTEITLANAMQSLKTIKLSLTDFDKIELSELIDLETPLEVIQIVCECILILKGAKDISWKSVKTVFNEETFMKSLIDLSCDAITYKQLLLCKSHLKVRRSVYAFYFLSFPGKSRAIHFKKKNCVFSLFSFCLLENRFQHIGINV